MILFAVIFSASTFCQKKTDIEKEKMAIQMVINEHMDAVDSLDVDRILEVLTEDHVDMPPNMPRVVGKEAYRAYFTPFIGFFEGLKNREMSFEVDEFVVSGEWAFQNGRYSTKFVTQENVIIEDMGNFVWMFRKDADGKWKWARVISNSTKPLQ